jgi:nicotinamidase-related amidase
MKKKKDMKKVLVVVDVQKDFYHPDGALYVKGGEVLPERIAKVIPEFDDVIFTVDWHPYNHCSFKENGGIWPVHCVAYTEGASLPKEFIPYIKTGVKHWTGATLTPCNIVKKGSLYTEEEYGANSSNFINALEDKYMGYEYVFSGIAGDYCVKETINNFIKSNPKEVVKVYLDGVASIDDGTTIREFMKENNIEEWKPQE